MTRRKLIFGFIKEHFSKPFSQVIALALIAALISAPIPFIYRYIIDGLGSQSGIEILSWALFYVSLLILHHFINFWKDMVLSAFQYKAAFISTTEVYKKVLRLPYHLIVKRGVEDMIKLVEVDSNSLDNTITYGAVNIISIMIQFIIDFVIMYLLFGWGVLVVIFIAPVYYFLIMKGMLNMEEYGRDFERKRETWFEDAYSPLYRLKEIKARRLEHFLFGNVQESNLQVYEAGEKYGKASTLLYSFHKLFDQGIYVIIFLAGAYGVVKGHLSLGTLFAAFYLSSAIITNLNDLSLAINNDYYKHIPALDRLVDLYSIEVESPDGFPADLPALNVEFDGVRFVYPDSKFELNIPSLQLSDNKRYVLVGRTGAGKSTLFDLLNGIRMPQEGSILFNGMQSSEISEEWWKKNSFVLLQDSHIFRGNIEDNILMEDVEFKGSLDNIIAEKGFTSFFTRFADGIKTDPREGVSLSGGEKRMVCLFRLMLNNQYKMILIDEGKTGLDAELRAQIDVIMQDALDARLSVTITHDLNEIVNYDEVIFVSEGTVVQDRHESLLERSEDYRDFVSSGNEAKVEEA